MAKGYGVINAWLPDVNAIEDLLKKVNSEERLQAGYPKYDKIKLINLIVNKGIAQVEKEMGIL